MVFAMEIDDATEIVFREALRRLCPGSELNPDLLQRTMAEVVQERGEFIFAQLSDEARGQLLREGLRVKDQAARLKRLEEAIEYGRGLIAKYDAETLGELPQEEQLEFARLWANATGGAKLDQN